MATTGGCRCGALRYTLAPGLRPGAYACHRLDGQTRSGSAFTQNALPPREATGPVGPAASYTHAAPSGSVPGQVVVRAGTLDAGDRLEPAAHIWVRRQRPWLVLPDGVPAWDETPAPEAFQAALRRT